MADFVVRKKDDKVPESIGAVIPINDISFLKNISFLLRFPEIVSITLANNTGKKLESFSEKVFIVDIRKFDHGSVRNFCAKFAKGDVLLFMTQDAVVYDDSFAKEILNSFRRNDMVKAVYGKHICPQDANVFERFERNYVYSDKARIQSFKYKMSFEDMFVSNVCFCVLRDTFEEVGGFPDEIICSEELVLSLKILQRGYQIMYNPKIKVIHCHNEDIGRTFRRWFDIGAFFSKYPHIYKLMKVKSYGRALVFDEFKFFLRKYRFHRLPGLVLRSTIRYIALELGLYNRFIPTNLKRKISLNEHFWDEE